MRRSLLFTILIVLFILFFIADLAVGQHIIPIKQFFISLLSPSSLTDEIRLIIYEYRLPKAITAILAGISLSISGLIMQTIFRNPLAGPYVLGISSGASLGVAIFVLGFGTLLPYIEGGTMDTISIILSSSIGSFAVMLMIMLASLRIKNIMTILILGIFLGNIISAIVNIMQYFSQASNIRSFVLWSMGSLGDTSKEQLSILAPLVLVCLIILFIFSKQLNSLLIGESYAQSLGTNIKALRMLVFVITSILAGSITAFCGPIGFVGIAVPHIARLMTGTTEHKTMLVSCTLLGSSIMLFSDILSQLPYSNSSLPINSITALFGIPVILWIVLKRKNFSNV